MNHPTELTLMLFAEEAIGADMDRAVQLLSVDESAKQVDKDHFEC